MSTQSFVTFAPVKIFENLDYRNCPKNGTVWINNAMMQPKDAFGMANSVDPDQAAPLRSNLGLHCQQCRPRSDCSLRSNLIWVCTVCSDLSVPILKSFYGICEINFSSLGKLSKYFE